MINGSIIRGNGDEKKEKERHPIFDDERMKNIEERMAELILNEILDDGPKVSWADIGFFPPFSFYFRHLFYSFSYPNSYHKNN